MSTPAATSKTTVSNDRVAEAPRTPGMWRRFIAANVRICQGFFHPRLYTLSHMSAVGWWFERRVESLRNREHMLEFGCGRDFPLSRAFKNSFQRCDATDVEDPPASCWPSGVQFRRCGATLPYEDNQFDAVLIRSVVEHLPDPDATFRELDRVMKPGGYLFMNLPNKWDYVSVAATLSGSLKSSFLKNLVPGAWEDFPVFYRCNTRRALERTIQNTDLTIEHFRPMPGEPGYLRFFVPLYLVGAVYQFAISLLGLDLLQPAFVVILKKKGPHA